MSKLTVKLQKIVSEAVEAAKDVALQMVDEINAKYGQKLTQLASKLKTPLYLTVEEGTTHPLLVTVTLYHAGNHEATEQIKTELNEVWHLYPLTIRETKITPQGVLYTYKPEEEQSGIHS